MQTAALSSVKCHRGGGEPLQNGMLSVGISKSMAILAVNDGWFDSASDLLPPEKNTPLYSTAVKLVIKTSATRCNINDFGRYQRITSVAQ